MKRLRAPLAALLALLLFAAPQHYGNDWHPANEAARIYAALAVVDFGTLALDPVFDRYFPGWRAKGRPPNYDVAARGGRYLLDKAPGVTLLLIPVVALARLAGWDPDFATLAWLCALLFSAVPAALWLLLGRRRLGEAAREPSLASGAAAAAVLATPWLAFTGLSFGHALAAVLAGAGALLGLGPLRAGGREGRPARDALLGGLCLGWGVVTEFPVLLVALGVCAAAALDPARRRRLPWIALGALGPAAALLAWNAASFGAPLAFSYGFKANAGLSATHAHGLYGISWPSPAALAGLLFGTTRGLFFLAPWLLAAWPGAVLFAADRGRPAAWRILVPLAVFGAPLLIAGFGDWHGGRIFAPRYLVFSLPFMGIGAAALADALAARPRLRPLLHAGAGLVIVSLAVALLASFGYPYVEAAIPNPVMSVILPLTVSGCACPTIFSAALPAPLLLGAGGAIGLLLLAESLRRAPAPPGDASRAVPAADGRVTAAALLLAALFLYPLLMVALAPKTDGRILKERAFACELHGCTARAAAIERTTRGTQ